jgi:hypothetical protein
MDDQRSKTADDQGDQLKATIDSLRAKTDEVGRFEVTPGVASAAVSLDDAEQALAQARQSGDFSTVEADVSAARASIIDAAMQLLWPRWDESSEMLEQEVAAWVDGDGEWPGSGL